MKSQAIPYLKYDGMVIFFQVEGEHISEPQCVPTKT